jgi:hypothetical protein
MKIRLFIYASVIALFSTAAHAERERTECLTVAGLLGDTVTTTRLLPYDPNSTPSCGAGETQLKFMEVVSPVPSSDSPTPPTPKQTHTASVNADGSITSLDNNLAAVSVLNCARSRNCWINGDYVRTSPGKYTLNVDPAVWNVTVSLTCQATATTPGLEISNTVSLGGNGAPPSVAVEIDKVANSIANPADSGFDISCQGI